MKLTQDVNMYRWVRSYNSDTPNDIVDAVAWSIVIRCPIVSVYRTIIYWDIKNPYHYVNNDRG